MKHTINITETIWDNYKNNKLEKILEKLNKIEKYTNLEDILKQNIPIGWIYVSTFFPNYDLIDTDYYETYKKIKEPYNYHIQLLLKYESQKLWSILNNISWDCVIELSLITFAPYSKPALELLEKVFDLKRFLRIQENTHKQALKEIQNGKKESHWIWWTFPQLKGLGKSETSKIYSIKDIIEAEAFIAHPILKKRLIEVCQAILDSNKTVYEIFGNDAIKVRSCCKLFAEVSNDKNSVFHKLIKKYMWN